MLTDGGRPGGIAPVSMRSVSVEGRGLVVLLALVAGSLGVTVTAEAEPFRIGALAKRGVIQCLDQWGPTATYLSDEIPGQDFTLVPLAFDEIEDAVAVGDVDFILVNSAQYVFLEHQYGINRIASLRNLRQGRGYTEFGGVIFCLAENEDLVDLDDLRGKDFGAVAEQSFGGWIMAEREMMAAGLDPAHDLASLDFLGTHDAVVWAVLAGDLDAGTVRTDTLERMALEGKIDLDDFRIINAQPVTATFPFSRSTRLYPEWPLAKVRQTPDDIARQVTAALLGMSSDSLAAQSAHCTGWTVPLNYQRVHEALKDVRTAPYQDYGRITMTDFLQAHWPKVAGLLVLIGGLVLALVYAQSLRYRLRSSEFERLTLEEKHRAERNLRRSEERFKDLFENALDLIQCVDEDGRFQYVNPAWEEVLGYTAKDRRNLRLLDIVHPRDRSACKGYERSAELDGQIVDLALRYQTKEGREVFLEGNCHCRREEDQRLTYRYILHNATQRRRVESELIRLSQAIEQSSEMVKITNTTGNIQYVNPAFEATTGYGREEVIGRNPRLLQSGEMDGSFYTDLWQTIKAGQTWKGRFRNRKKTGALYLEEATISPVRGVGGEIVAFVGVSRDITRETDLEGQLRQSQKMEALGKLAGGIAHDFNNLLQVIGAGIDLAIDGLSASQHEMQEELEEVAKAGQRAASLVRQLLAFSRQQTLTMTQVSLNETVENVLTMLERLVKDGITLQVELEQGLPRIQGDVGQIEQILVNLVINARDAMPTGGQITIATKSHTLDKDFCRRYPWMKPGNYVALSVSDTGCGMDTQILDHIFEPFFSTKEHDRGSGLGLSTVYGIVKQHGGIVRVDSSVGQGSVFRLYLPAVEAAATSAKTAPRDAHAALRGDETILVAEDEDAVRRMARNMLRSAGYTVLEAVDGEEALKMFMANTDRIDGLLLDVVMPHMSGGEVLTQVRHIKPDVPAILTSGYRGQADPWLHGGHAVTDYLAKPYRMKNLLETMRRVLDARLDRSHRQHEG